MEKPAHHILVCGSFRTAGEPQGFCHKKGSNGFVAYLENELADRGLNDVMVSMTTCLKVCDRGPALVVYPENWWFGKIDGEEAIDAILDGLEAGKPAEDWLLC
jgi:(2Fe-2S) ferredoxin